MADCQRWLDEMRRRKPLTEIAALRPAITPSTETPEAYIDMPPPGSLGRNSKQTAPWSLGRNSKQTAAANGDETNQEAEAKEGGTADAEAEGAEGAESGRELWCSASGALHRARGSPGTKNGVSGSE